MAESFTVTLVSNQNEDMFANNTSSSFSNALPRTTDLSNYEVALESIYLTDVYPRDVAVAVVEPEEKQFFNLEEKDNEITIVQVNASELKPRKRTEVFTEFLDSINTDAEFVNMPVNLIYTVTGPDVTQIALQYSPTPGYTLQLASPLNNILGFKELEFAAGMHISDTKIDVDAFKALAIGFVGSLSEISESRTHIELAQIPEKPDLENLLSLISLSLANANHTLTLTVDNKKGIVNYKVPNISKRIVLSEFLNTYLGRPDLFAFYNEGSFKVHKKIIDRKQVESATEVAFQPRSLVYKPTQAGKFNQIKISLRADNNELLPSQENPSVVNLHFRKTMKDIVCEESGSCKLISMDAQMQTDDPKDLILLERDRSSSRSPSPPRFVVRKRKQIKGAPRVKAVSVKKKAEGKGRPKQLSKQVKKAETKRGRPSKVAKLATKPRGRPPKKPASKSDPKRKIR